MGDPASGPVHPEHLLGAEGLPVEFDRLLGALHNQVRGDAVIAVRDVLDLACHGSTSGSPRSGGMPEGMARLVLNTGSVKGGVRAPSRRSRTLVPGRSGGAA